MNCNTFIKRLDDYIENNITDDLKEAMDKHMGRCESCRKAYEDELEIQNMFKRTFIIDGMEFSSSRAEIMNGIDKSRYSKKKTNKILFYIKKNKFKYMSVAAVLTITMISFPAFMDRYFKMGLDSSKSEQKISIAENSNEYTKKSEDKVDNKEFSLEKKSDNGDVSSSKEEKIINQGITVDEKNGLMDSDNSNEDIVNYNSLEQDSNGIERKANMGIAALPIKEEEKYIPKFIKKDLGMITPEFSSPWESSPDGKLSACIEGLGEFGIEEGVGKVYIKNNSTNLVASFELTENEKQYSPKVIEWWDNDHIFVIVGYGYGTIQRGGNVYILNINSGETNIVYESIDNKEKVIDIKKEGESLTLKFLVYNDDTLNEYHYESGTVSSYKIKEPNSIKIKSESGSERIGEINPIFN